MADQPRGSKWKSVFFRTLAILIPLLLIEAGIRAYDMTRGASPRARTHWYWAFEQDRFLGYRPRRDLDMQLHSGIRLDTNADGFRDDPIPVTPPGDRRLIICMGESSTWGFGASTRDATWPNRLESILQEVDPRFVVLNAGMPGYSTVENVQLLQMRLLKYEPEAVVYMGFRNDLSSYALFLRPEVDLNFFPRPFAMMPATETNEVLMRSALFAFGANLLRGRFDRQGIDIPAGGTTATERGEAVFRDQIALMTLLCRRHGTQLIWVDQPVNVYAPEISRKREGLLDLRRVLHEELAIQAIPLLEAHDQYDLTQYPMTDDVHFTEDGMQHLAEILAPQLLEALEESDEAGSGVANP